MEPTQDSLQQLKKQIYLINSSRPLLDSFEFRVERISMLPSNPRRNKTEDPYSQALRVKERVFNIRWVVEYRGKNMSVCSKKNLTKVVNRSKSRNEMETAIHLSYLLI